MSGVGGAAEAGSPSASAAQGAGSRKSSKARSRATSDKAVVTTDIVIADAEAPSTLRSWGASGTGLWMLHKNEDLRPQHEACLFEAAFTDNVKLAQEMIDAKVDVNCRHRQKGRTPLHYCALGNGALVARVGHENVCV